MNNTTPENPLEVPVVEAISPSTPAVVAPPPSDNRRRLRDLLSIPERDRSDEQWDEIIELEIQLAPGNRISGNENAPGQERVPFHHKPGGSPGQPKKHRPRSNNNGGGNNSGGSSAGGGNNSNRRPRQNKPPSGGSPA